MGNYHVDLPYPEVIIDSPGIKDVRCLMEDYGGGVSETSAILQYIYQSYTCSAIGEEWRKLFEGIAVSEMHHHALLGNAIVKLGARPVIGGNRQYWHGSYIDYTTDLKGMIMADIRGEEAAIAGYRRSIDCLDNYTIIELLERIILDEELHISLLKDALERLNEECAAR